MSDKVIDFQAARLARQRAGAQQIEAPAGGFKDRVGAPGHAETHSVYRALADYVDRGDEHGAASG